MDRTDSKIDTQLTRGCSGDVRYEVVNCMGVVSQQKFATAREAVAFARRAFPDQQQDEDRAGLGWDIQIAGS